MMTPCEPYKELLSARLDGELTQEENVQLEHHLAQCPSCRQLARDLEQIHTQLTDLLPPAAVPDLTDTILAQLQPRPSHCSRPQRPLVWGLCAAGLALAVLAGVRLVPPFSSLAGQTVDAPASTQEVEVPTQTEVESPEPAPASGEMELGEQESPAEAQTDSEPLATPPPAVPSSPPQPLPRTATPHTTPTEEGSTSTPQAVPKQADDASKTETPDTAEAIPGANTAGVAPYSRQKDPLTQQDAQDALTQYLSQQGLSLTLSPLGLDADGGNWLFSAQEDASTPAVLFSVSRQDGTICELPTQ